MIDEQPRTADPGDVPLAELQPLLDDPQMSFEAIGIYTYLRSRELAGNGSYLPDTRRSLIDELQPLTELVAAGHLRETPFGYRTT